MIHLDPAECRVLGVLVEKAHTSSAYPMSLNALADGCNQKSNRNPVVNYDEDRVIQTLDRLRAKGLVVFADALGSRVTKFRHLSREALGVDDYELVVLVEMLLRGPQTAAELRLRASRMKPLEQADVRDALERLMARPEPMVQRLAMGRAERYAQLLCPTLHPLDEAAYAAPATQDAAGEQGQSSQQAQSQSPQTAASASIAAAGSADAAAQADRLAQLEAQVLELRQIIERLANALGAADILKP